jgi:hypothetical protein
MRVATVSASVHDVKGDRILCVFLVVWKQTNLKTAFSPLYPDLTFLHTGL